MSRQNVLPWFMWSLPLLFFAFQFVLRLFPGLVMSEFFAAYPITARDFGMFASLYYLGYAGMQIPIALLLDRVGPRIIISLSAALCGIAVLMMVYIHSWPVALLSRFLIGVGSVVGFLGTSKVISQWFSEAKYTRMVGLTFSFGLVGALYGQRPVSILLEQFGWEKVSLMLGASSIGLGMLIFGFLRNRNGHGHDSQRSETQVPFWISLKRLFTNKPLLLLAVANFLMVGALEGFADVWGISFLMAAKGITKTDASSVTSFIFVGMLFGGPILAFFSERFNAHWSVTALSGLLMAGFLAAVLWQAGSLPSSTLMPVMFLLGILCCYQVIVFSIGAKLVPVSELSLTIAFLNCINMLGGSFFHGVIGKLMDVVEPHAAGDAASYAPESFALALAVIPAASLGGALLVWVCQRLARTPKAQLTF